MLTHSLTLSKRNEEKASLHQLKEHSKTKKNASSSRALSRGRLVSQSLIKQHTCTFMLNDKEKQMHKCANFKDLKHLNSQVN